jgi:hypothetical protein
MPNEMPLLFEKMTVPPVAVCVPAAMAPRSAADAVTTLPLSPKLTLFAFENVSALRLFEVVPAETFTAVSDVATLAVIVEAFKPNEIPFELLNVKADARLLVVPALRLMLA